MNKTEKKPETILCIPGNWNERTEIVTKIVENNKNKFIFVGTVLLNLETNKGVKMEIYPRDSMMRNAFRIAGMVNRVSEDFLDEIDKHKYVIYLSAETGDMDSARAIAEAGNAILRSGGTGIKVESTGKAFTKEHWSALLSDFKEPKLYQMYVLDSITNGKGATYTCGMHNLGLKDCIVYKEKVQCAIKLLSIFGYYQLVDKPEIKDGQTFSIDRNSPIFEITEEINQPNKGDELFENPFGMWQLNRIAGQ